MTIVGNIGPRPAIACTCGAVYELVKRREPDISKDELEARREAQRVRRLIDGKEVPCSH